MVIDQLSILDAIEAPTTETPRCRMCARPARWITTAQEWGMYCAGRSCSNRERICQACGESFVMNVDGAGTKYCSTRCKAVGYRPSMPGRAPFCAWCGKVNPNTAMGRGGPNRVWPYICGGCLAPIKHVVDRLKAHHVPHERARRLLDDPGCEVCGVDILAKARESSHGKVRSLLVVDHDHGCCPVDSHSCGQCIRGLICRGCNAAAGLLRDEPKHARALADYLESWFSRPGPQP